jgi:arabinogalactan endo-1,4-beta-galactosidase
MKYTVVLVFASILLSSCNGGENDPGNQGTDTARVYYPTSEFVMGADLSYVNQILDHGGQYKDSGIVENPYLIFRQHGCNVVRLRLFHTPTWTKDIYGAGATQMYNDFEDVKESIQRAKEKGMQVCLDFHYSDSWADPSKQVVPAAWQGLTLQLLHDSIYNYTYSILDKLNTSGLMPEYVQTGNEINPGFVLPSGKRWDDNELNMIYLLNSAIKAVRDAASKGSVNPKIILHIAQPENADSWFNGLASRGLVDFDIIGISYYYMWSTTGLAGLKSSLLNIKSKYGKEVMVMETAYPWTTGNADSYNNIITVNKIIPSYPATPEGQFAYMKALTQQIIDGGARGIFYWEPAWITSDMKDSWGTGSSWDCNTLFDFNGNVNRGMRYMTWKYTGLTK